MVNRERILAGVAQYMTVLGMILPAAYVAPIALFEISGYFGRLDLLAWMSDLAMLLSVPWELIATLLIILRWRDLPQRFWITLCERTSGLPFAAHLQDAFWALPVAVNDCVDCAEQALRPADTQIFAPRDPLLLPGFGLD